MRQPSVLPTLDEYGFREPIMDQINLFQLSFFEIPGFPSATETIKIFMPSEQCLIIVTDSNKIFRWKYQSESKLLNARELVE